jgi:putative nucleotidyltransferase with HDIG domain
MARLMRILDRVFPKQGVLSTMAGRRLALGMGALILGASVFAVLVIGALVTLTESAGKLPSGSYEAILIGLAGGLATVVLAFMLLPLVGRFSGIASDYRLLELSNPGSPLLRDLMAEAPGTYSHSIMAGSLAERAAAAIGANPLLARVGAYYHDIGKMVRPTFFVENQAGRANPHDIASPVQSAFVITAHVREGAELARKNRLPDAVVGIINEHHGTSLVTCFYEKARQGDGAVLEADFRYDGERPRSREAALVMLADVAEAAARAITSPTVPRLQSTVRRVVEAKVADGQLRDSHMSKEDIDRAIDVYATMLMSVYHPRIAYPEDAESRRQEHAGTRDEQPRP